VTVTSLRVPFVMARRSSSSATNRRFRGLRAARLAVLALLGLACSDPRLHRRPADVVFSVGVWDGAGGPPQSSGPVTLAFGAAEAGPAAVVAAYLARPVVVDGDPAEWSAIPASEIPISSAGARTGLTEADFYCRYRSRLALVTDPFTGASGCPTACDPANRPATRDEASAGCSLPFPRFDHDVARLTVKAGYDEHRLYLLLQWPDPSEDRGARTWRFDPDAATWLAGSEAEDRAAVSFDGGSVPSSHAALGCAGACHLAGPIAAPAPGTPPGLIAPAYLAQFTMHTDGDGQRVDAWEWRAAGTDPLGLADDLFWNAQRLQGDCPTPGACLDACLLSPAGPGCAAWRPPYPTRWRGPRSTSPPASPAWEIPISARRSSSFPATPRRDGTRRSPLWPRPWARSPRRCEVPPRCPAWCSSDPARTGMTSRPWGGGGTATGPSSSPGRW